MVSMVVIEPVAYREVVPAGLRGAPVKGLGRDGDGGR